MRSELVSFMVSPRIVRLSFSAVSAAVFAVAAVAVAPVQASGNVYRCGNEYTNQPSRIQRGGCVIVTGGAVTVVRNAGRGNARPVSAAKAAVPRKAAANVQAVSLPSSRHVVASSVQRARDGGARNILQAELNKAMQRLGELRREYNNGEPERLGSEAKNYQKYLDRVAGLRAGIQRAESDIAGLQRELGRAGS